MVKTQLKHNLSDLKIKFYYSTTTRFRNQPCATCLIDECQVGTPINRNLLPIPWSIPYGLMPARPLRVHLAGSV